MKKTRTHKIRRTIGYLFIALLLVGIFWNAFQYFKLKKTAGFYLNQEQTVHVEEPVDLTGLLDSYGVPYSPSVEKSFMRYLEEDLRDQDMLSSSLDLYGLYINKTWELDGIFQNKVTIGEMKTMQNFGMDFVRHKYGSERIREDLVYSCDKSLEDVTVADYYSSLKNPVVLYSCTANDLFYYFNTSLESLSLSRIWMIIKNYGNALSMLENEVRSNLEALTTNNPDSVIMVMGLYVPSDNFFLQRVGSVVIDRVNRILERICGDYPNAVYVDVSCLAFTVLEGDFHPNGDGHQILRNILAEKISAIDFSDAKTQKPVPDESKEQETEDVKTADSFTMKEWMEWIDQLDLPKRDYVEWAVAAEQALYEKGLDGVTYDELQELMRQLPEEMEEEEKKGLEILRIERKMHEGVDLEGYTIKKGVGNDKVSLIDHMF